MNRGPVDERSIHIGRFHRNGRERTPIKGPKEIHTVCDHIRDLVVNECLGSLWPRKVIEYEENSADITLLSCTSEMASLCKRPERIIFVSSGDNRAVGD